MTVSLDGSLAGIDWSQVEVDLAADHFDNGRSPDALRRSFERSQHVAVARDGSHVVGVARLLSDGVCNAYLLDVWTLSGYRHGGIATRMVRHLASLVPGQHLGLQTDLPVRSTPDWASVPSRSSCPSWWGSGSTTRPTGEGLRNQPG